MIQIIYFYVNKEYSVMAITKTLYSFFNNKDLHITKIKDIYIIINLENIITKVNKKNIYS